MSSEQIKQAIAQAIEENKDEIIRIGEQILRHPETGYREEKTSLLVRETFEALGLSYSYPHAVTGVKATLGNKANAPNVCIIGELDAVKCAAHPHAATDGSAHACGHHAQIAAMLGAAIALTKSGVMEQLGGNITFFAVPAEEFIELEYRTKLREMGKISYFGGKQQLIAEGAFDDIDMAMMLHAQPNAPEGKVYAAGTNLGFLAKNITLRGKAAHGSTPYEGTNALNAAALAILGIHANRETFLDEDKIRIHPIITKGGDVVNSVPDEVCIETYVRGATFAAIQKGNAAVERAVHGAADMIGAKVEIDDIPGYLPLHESEGLLKVFTDCTGEVIGKDNIIYGAPLTGSSDIGDLSMIMPTIQPSIGGFDGNLHASEFTVADPEKAYLLPAKLMALTAIALLENDAMLAKNVLNGFTPDMTKEEYMNYLKGE
ncbi:MAG: amidohydrolase [Ruminococcaceae bacterium]|nr:amidohydrolase [Oscillospiraceae bacterium]